MLYELMFVLKHRWLESNLRLDYLILIVLYSKLNKKHKIFLGSYVVLKSDTDLISISNSNVIVLVSPVLVTMCLQAPLQSFTATNRTLSVQWGGIKKFQTLIFWKELSNICMPLILQIYILYYICQLHIFYQVYFHENGASTELLMWGITLFPRPTLVSSFLNDVNIHWKWMNELI